MSDTPTHDGPATDVVLGSYRILHELSSGGMGTVFRAEHVLLGRPAAVKVLRRDLSASPVLVQRLFNEARAVTACKHPGIVELYDFGFTDDGHAFLVMEYLEGESLGRRLAHQRLAELEATAIAHSIASALKAAHRVGVIHRDLKPDNVFLVPDPDGGADRTKVLDFGIAKLADAAPSQGTQTGALIGTPLYMAPEQARAAAAIDHRADLYSLGCILYHMVAGRPPFVADGAGEIIALQMFGEVVPPSQLAPVSPELDRLVLRLLEKDPAQRFASAGELVTALAGLDRRPTRRMTRPGLAAGEIAVPRALVVPPADHAAIEAAIEAVIEAEVDASVSAEPPPPAGAATTAQIRRRTSLPRIAGAIGLLAIAAAAALYATREATAPDAPRAPSTPASHAPAPAPAPARVVEPPAPVAPPPAAPQESPRPTPPSEAPAPTPHASPAAPHRRPGRKSEPGVGSITPPGSRILPAHTVEVHRGPREGDRPTTGDHTSQGAPIEDTIDIKPTRGSGAPRPSPSPPKDPSSP